MSETDAATNPAAGLSDDQIARRFVAIADILEIGGENPFKVRAYRSAAATVLELEDSLADLNERGALDSLPGFGDAIVAKTQDFLARGTTALWERIKDTVPAGVVQVASIPGIGPKTAKALWEGLAITDVAALETAARGEKIRTLAGFGAAKEAQLLEKIAAWRRLTERIPRFVALSIAERLARDVRKIDGVARVEIVGELRRGCESVARIDLVAGVARDRESAEAAIVALPGWESAGRDTDGGILLRSPDGLSAMVDVDANADLGWAMLLRTGPKSFVDALPQAGDQTAIASDDAFFDAVSLPFIEPELRDWPDAVERAKAGTLPVLVNAADFRGQLHEHTTYSDGRASVREMAEAALALGYEYLAITDHSRSLVIANGLSRDRLLAQLDEIAVVNAEFIPRGLTLLSGLEADILADGSLDMDDDVLARLDIVVGSVHVRHREDAAAMTKRMVTAIENPHLDIIGHPTGRLLGRRESYPVDIAAVIDAAAKHKKALEINASGDRMDLKDEHARAAKAAGVVLTVNADAHSTAGLADLSYGLCMARRAGLTKNDLLNGWPLERLRQWLAGH